MGNTLGNCRRNVRDSKYKPCIVKEVEANDSFFTIRFTDGYVVHGDTLYDRYQIVSRIKSFIGDGVGLQMLRGEWKAETCKLRKGQGPTLWSYLTYGLLDDFNDRSDQVD